MNVYKSKQINRYSRQIRDDNEESDYAIMYEFIYKYLDEFEVFSHLFNESEIKEDDFLNASLVKYLPFPVEPFYGILKSNLYIVLGSLRGIIDSINGFFDVQSLIKKCLKILAMSICDLLAATSARYYEYIEMMKLITRDFIRSISSIIGYEKPTRYVGYIMDDDNIFMQIVEREKRFIELKTNTKCSSTMFMHFICYDIKNTRSAALDMGLFTTAAIQLLIYDALKGDKNDKLEAYLIMENYDVFFTTAAIADQIAEIITVFIDKFLTYCPKTINEYLKFARGDVSLFQQAILPVMWAPCKVMQFDSPTSKVINLERKYPAEFYCPFSITSLIKNLLRKMLSRYETDEETITNLSNIFAYEVMAFVASRLGEGKRENYKDANKFCFSVFRSMIIGFGNEQQDLRYKINNLLLNPLTCVRLYRNYEEYDDIENIISHIQTHVIISNALRIITYLSERNDIRKNKNYGIFNIMKSVRSVSLVLRRVLTLNKKILDNTLLCDTYILKVPTFPQMLMQNLTDYWNLIQTGEGNQTLIMSIKENLEVYYVSYSSSTFGVSEESDENRKKEIQRFYEFTDFSNIVISFNEFDTRVKARFGKTVDMNGSTCVFPFRVLGIPEYMQKVADIMNFLEMDNTEISTIPSANEILQFLKSK